MGMRLDVLMAQLAMFEATHIAYDVQSCMCPPLTSSTPSPGSNWRPLTCGGCRYFEIQWVMNWNARTDGEEDQRDAERGHSSQRGGNNGCNKAQPMSWLSWCHSTSTSQGNPGVGACGPSVCVCVCVWGGGGSQGWGRKTAGCT
jgi:hypothetical protein